MTRRSRQLTYYGPGPGLPEPEPERPDALWGWTLPEIHDIARAAAIANRWYVSDIDIRYEAAWDGIIDHLLAADERPDRHYLAQVAKGSVSRKLLKDFCHTYGVAGRDLANGIGSAPNFAVYWNDRRDTAFDDRIAEREALRQVMGTLSPAHREALETLAAVGTLEAGAVMLGISRGAFQRRTRLAREAFEARWYAPEAPPPGKRSPVKYSPNPAAEQRLKPCGTHAAFRRHKNRGEEVDEACEAAGKAYDRNRPRRRRAAGQEAA